MQQVKADQVEDKTLLTESLVESQINEAPDDEPKKNCLQRTFGPIKPGSMRGSILTFLACSMGVGIFNLPFRISEIGIINFLVYLVATGLFSFLGMWLMSRVILKYDVESYSTMSEKAYGKGFRKVAQFCLIVFPWGNTICYVVLFTQFLMQLLSDTFGIELYEGDVGRQNQTYSDLGSIVRIAISIGSIMINMFFILKKDISVLHKISVVGVIAVIFNVVVMVITLFIGFSVTVNDQETSTVYDYHGISTVDWGQLNWVSGWETSVKQIQALASMVFSYLGHHLVFPLLKTLRNPIKRRIDTIFRRVLITQIISYFLVGMAGYLLLAEHVQDRPINAMVIATVQTIPISIGKFLIVFAVFFNIPINIFGAREVVYETFELERNNKNHVLISISVAFSATLTAVLFQRVNSYFGLFGGTTGVMLASTIPMICYIKLIGMNSWQQKLMAVFMFLISILAITGGILSVVYL